MKGRSLTAYVVTLAEDKNKKKEIFLVIDL